MPVWIALDDSNGKHFNSPKSQDITYNRYGNDETIKVFLDLAKAFHTVHRCDLLRNYFDKIVHYKNGNEVVEQVEHILAIFFLGNTWENSIIYTPRIILYSGKIGQPQQKTT